MSQQINTTTQDESDNKESEQETAQGSQNANRATQQETRRDPSTLSRLEELFPEWVQRFSADNILVEELGLAMMTFSSILTSVVLSVTLPLTWKSLRYGQVALFAVGILGVMVGTGVTVRARKSRVGGEDAANSGVGSPDED